MSGARFDAVVMGASAGALTALSGILPALPAEYPLPLLVVVHQPPDKHSLMPGLLQAKCRLAVREAEDKEPIEGGTVYLAPPDYHLLVENRGQLSLSSEEPVRFARPSIDVLFESAADVYGERLIGIVLTGANDDGAQGLRTIYEAGGTALVEHPERAEVGAMPQAALRACPQALALSSEDITRFLLEAAQFA